MTVVVVGAGPAGIAAAGAAARAGVRVVLVDAAARPGGQYHRQNSLSPEGEFGLPEGVEHLADSSVWAVEPIDGGHRVHVRTGRADGPGRRGRRVDTPALVLATGAYDRALPFPGWTLPGVYTAGAAQALVKGQGVAVGDRVLLAGTGPFLLPVAESLLDAGAGVLGVFEAGRPFSRWLRDPRGMFAGRGKLAELARYARVLAANGVPYRTRTTVIAAHGVDRVEEVTTARLDPDWNVLAGTEQRVRVDAVCVGFGFTPQLELAVAARCKLHDGFVLVDAAQATSVPGVFAAGEITGIGGAEPAAAEGEVAGTAAAVRLGARPRAAPGAACGAARAPVRGGVGTRAPGPSRMAGTARRRHAGLPLRRGGPPGAARGGRRARGLGRAVAQARQPGRTGPVPGPDLRPQRRRPGSRDRSRRARTAPRGRPGAPGRVVRIASTAGGNRMTHEKLGGVVVATALPYAADPAAPAGLRVDLDRYAEHCRWLVDNGCRGVGPNGSLGEYSSLTDDERRAVARTAVDAIGSDGVVVVGVHGVGSHQARQWAERAAEDGADGVLCLPPTMYRANTTEVIGHFEQVAAVGLPVMVYNNPIDTKVDLTPEVVAEIARIDNVVAVKEFSGDVRRVLRIRELAPELEVVAGADDVVLESLLMGATGWFAGFPNVFPAESVRLFELARAGELEEARALYEPLVAAFRWDSRTEFVQAIKRGMEMVGRFGGPCRPPRGPLPPEELAALEADMRRAVDHLAARPVVA